MSHKLKKNQTHAIFINTFYASMNTFYQRYMYIVPVMYDRTKSFNPEPKSLNVF